MKADKFRPIVRLIGLVGLLLGGLMTAAAQTPSPTATPLPTKTPVPTATFTPTPTPQGKQLILQIASGEDDVNETNDGFEPDKPELWIGNGGETSDQYLGLRFTNVSIPPGSIIHAAHLEVYLPKDQWLRLSFNIAAEAADDSKSFSDANPPSKRKLTTAMAKHNSNVIWTGNIFYPLDEMGAVIQEIVSRPGWQMGNSLSVIAVGTEAGGKFGRKYFVPFEVDPKKAVRLVIDFTPGKIPPSPVPPTATATPAASPTVDPCEIVPLSIRLKVGQKGQVVVNSSSPNTPLNVRKTPSVDSERLGRLSPGVTFTVIDGPTCDNDVAWFKISYGDNNAEGWIAEGQGSAYFVEPVK